MKKCYEEAGSNECGKYENFIQTKFGYCFYCIEPTPLIYNLYVHPQYRKRGHSKMLLQYVMNEIKRTGYEGEIGIQVAPREASIDSEHLTDYYIRMGLKIQN
ncbi:MAG: GNAT family N-acetyltransferase [Candidatus Heimdallarchaeaceae archaeon]